MNVKFCLISVINSNLMNGFCILPYYIFVIGKGRPNNIPWRIVRPLGQKKGKYNLCHVLAYETSCGVWEPWDSPHGWVKQQKGLYKREWIREREVLGSTGNASTQWGYTFYSALYISVSIRCTVSSN